MDIVVGKLKTLNAATPLIIHCNLTMCATARQGWPEGCRTFPYTFKLLQIKRRKMNLSNMTTMDREAYHEY